MTFMKEYRACGLDRDATEPDQGQWHLDRSLAVRDLGNLNASHPPYVRAWLEARVVTTPVEIVRVEDDVVSPVRGLEGFMRALDGVTS